MTCPGSYALCEAAEAGPSSSFAVAGTIAHALAERCLADPAYVPEDALDETHQLQGHEVIVDAEMVRTVHVYLEAVRRRARPGCVVRHETRVNLANWWIGQAPPPTPMFGTADTWIFDPWTRRLSVVDFKYGSGVYVAVQDNPQLLYYAAGVVLQIPELVRDIELVVVQPRARGQEPVRADVLDLLDLRLWIDNQLKPAVARVQEADAELVTGTHCRFCAARPTCPAYADRAQAAARADFPDDLPALLVLRA